VFDSSEFAVLARQIVAGDLSSWIDGRMASAEARTRAAFGRAYYTLFLAVRGAISRKHGIPEAKIRHGTLYTQLQNSKAPAAVRRVGKHLEELYRLRQQADYELQPKGVWEKQLTDAEFADLMASQALDYAATADSLDYSAVLHLLV
jgi:hypothetical protein